MTRHVDLLVVGAGPAGMSAAITARQYGLEVLVVDEQPSPGGQIWRAIEAVTGKARAEILGKAYRDGADVVRQFRASGAVYEPRTQVWQLESGPRAYMTRDGNATSVDADAVLLATGAQERPVPFPGWDLPGVMTVGAAQILLKTSGQIPEKPVWIAGSGPLVLLYAVQLLRAGGQIAGFLDTTPSGNVADSWTSLTKAVFGAPKEMLKGVRWILDLKRKVHYIRNVCEIEAIGNDAIEHLRYTMANGKSVMVDAELLLIHEGVVPTIHPTLALGCRHIWNADQKSFTPDIDNWGETSEPGVFVAGDSAGIGGATAACRRGEIAALRVAAKSGRLAEAEAARASEPIRRQLKRALAARPFLDNFYRPRPAIFAPSDKTLACRCEEVTVASIRELAFSGQRDPNQVKASTRSGMGPCQGRQCNYTVASILASTAARPMSEVGLYRVRPPFKTLTLGELSALNSMDKVS